MAVTALYVHVPFCAQKCRYCDFDSRSFAAYDLDAALDSYFEQLYARLDSFGDAGALAQVCTVYTGGGTPSLAGERLVELARRISMWCKPFEFTCEANPESLTAELATALAEAGVTRISLGVQTLDNTELAAIGRIHDANRALAAIATVKDAGLDVSCDLMCGLPGQTAANWRSTLDGVLAAAPHHVSVYPLTLEEGTPLYRMACRDESLEPDEDFQASCMDAARERLGAAGYHPYEVASYALDGHECAHNIAYWTGRGYLAWAVLPPVCLILGISTVLQVCSPACLLEATRTVCVWFSATMTRRRLSRIPVAARGCGRRPDARLSHDARYCVRPVGSRGSCHPGR